MPKRTKKFWKQKKNIIAVAGASVVVLILLFITASYSDLLGARMGSGVAFRILGPSSLTQGETTTVTWDISTQFTQRYPYEKIEFCYGILRKNCILLASSAKNNGSAVIKVPSNAPTGSGYLKFTARDARQNLSIYVGYSKAIKLNLATIAQENNDNNGGGGKGNSNDNNPTPTPTPQATFIIDPTPKPNSPYIASISPTQGPVGTIITIIGTGFSATGNTIHFAEGGQKNLMATNNGTRISYAIPKYVSGCDLWGSPMACTQNERMVVKGSYPITVTTQQNKITNEVMFSVTDTVSVSPTPTITPKPTSTFDMVVGVGGSPLGAAIYAAHFYVVRIDPTSVYGLWAKGRTPENGAGYEIYEYRTIVVGDEVGAPCENYSIRLKQIDYSAKKATFTYQTVSKPSSGCSK